MPETRLAKLRGTLPEGYQFGAGAHLGAMLGLARALSPQGRLYGLEVMAAKARRSFYDAMGIPTNSSFDEASGWRLDA